MLCTWSLDLKHRHGKTGLQARCDIAPPGLAADPDAAALAAVASTLQDAATATLAAILATNTAAVAASAKGPDDDDNQGECRLMGPFALFVQLALGGLAMLSLVYKRWRERPQRPVKIWFFDVSKQVFGSVLVHIANVFMSMLTSGRFSIKAETVVASRLMARTADEYTPNPCSFYLLNLAIDTTIGIPILIILLRITTGLIAYTRLGQPPESIQSGHYGSPPNAWWWLKQSVIYFMGLFGMKICVLIIFLMIPSISQVGDWALSWTEGNEKLQIAFSMMIFPLIMNALQYYIIDSFIKKKESTEHEAVPTEEPDESRRRYDDDHVRSSGSYDGEHERHDQRLKMQSRVRASLSEEYDPDVDGEAASSSHQQRRAGSKVPSELYPKE
ncbi:Vacuolar membrane protein [Paramyrothecium foliicola]|nr:Vacuolar membrane protein [Paramyrothecium foliicola]